MKKYLYIFIFVLTLQTFAGRDLMLRRFNEGALQQQFVYNSTVKIQILKNLSAYDYSQIEQNSGRLFIRDKIIYE